MPAAEVGRMPQEVEGGHGAGRVVRIVEPQDRRTVPRCVVDGVEVRQEAVRLEQGQPTHVAPGEPRAALGDRVPGRGDEHEILALGGSSVACASENTISFEPSSGSTSVVGIDVARRTAAEPSPTPPRAAPGDPRPAGTRRSARSPRAARRG